MNQNRNPICRASQLALAVLTIMTLAALVGCNLTDIGKATVAIKATSTGASASLASRAVTAGTAVTTVSSYKVVFKKIEIGNSETDKYTLWEDATGVTKDIAAAVSFDNVRAVPVGSYQFVRLTIGDTLNVAGSIIDGATTYTGSGTATLGDTVYLWGTTLFNAAGQSTLAGPVTIKEGGSLSFNFNIAGTVTYLSGASSAAVLGVSKPVLSLTSQ